MKSKLKKASSPEPQHSSEIRKTLTQSEVAKALKTTPRMLIYWETQGLIHPSQDVRGKGRRTYTQEDVEEIRFVKNLLEDGFSSTSLKARLKALPSPYRYNPGDIFWDSGKKTWRSREEIALDFLLGKFTGFYRSENSLVRLIHFFFDVLERKVP